MQDKIKTIIKLLLSYVVILSQYSFAQTTSELEYLDTILQEIDIPFEISQHEMLVTAFRFGRTIIYETKVSGELNDKLLSLSRDERKIAISEIKKNFCIETKRIRSVFLWAGYENTFFNKYGEVLFSINTLEDCAKHDKSSSIHASASEIQNRINKISDALNFPVKIDEYTSLGDILENGNSIIYKFIISDVKWDIIKHASETFIKSYSKATCNNNESISLMSVWDPLSVEYELYSESGELIINININEDCKKKLIVPNMLNDDISTNSDSRISKYKLDASNGDAIAQFNLATLYEKGSRVEKNDELANKWYKKAADQGLNQALFNLALRLEKGNGIPQDFNAAAKLYKKSASQGDPHSQFNLGVLYKNGTGVIQNYSEAFKWWVKSAEQGFSHAQNNLGTAYDKGQGVKKDQSMAAQWYLKAANQGGKLAQFNLGYLYAKGFGVQRNYDKAIKFYRLSARQGHPPAQSNLGLMYYKGHGLDQDYTLAYMWFEIADRNGHSMAKKNKKVTALMGKVDIQQALSLSQICIESSYKNCGY